MREWKSKADINDRNWKYIPAAATDVAKTIKRVQKEMEELAAQTKEKPSVISIKRKMQ